MPGKPRRRAMSGAYIRNRRAKICAGCEGYVRPQDKQCPSCGRIDTITFDSHAELKRYGELRLLEKVGKITFLKRQPRSVLHAAATAGGGIKVGTYVADFSYFIKASDGMICSDLVFEDVKGGDAKGYVDTPLAAWKRRHFEAEYGLTVSIIVR